MNNLGKYRKKETKKVKKMSGESKLQISYLYIYYTKKRNKNNPFLCVVVVNSSLFLFLLFKTNEILFVFYIVSFFF